MVITIEAVMVIIVIVVLLNKFENIKDLLIQLKFSNFPPSGLVEK